LSSIAAEAPDTNATATTAAVTAVVTALVNALICSPLLGWRPLNPSSSADAKVVVAST
jgi:hypothetical protein